MGLTLKRYSIFKRLIAYAILGVLAIVVPYLFTIIMITGDRVAGMSYALLPGIYGVHVIFGYIMMRPLTLKKGILTLFLSALCFMAIFIMGRFSLFPNFGFDIYGFWDIAISNFLVGLVVWETAYQILKKRKESQSTE